ncbi:zinc ABC transporter substrate-binding protein [Budviciaceae bacterium CWB-B4]|uniref:Zinc ABC transporter substrate-binding protein n=1 Tax=Limnobaculum xujianqingii TaxID=2738837 RepID=A0A9D7AK85_9GAMM|nr:zinc ABC transporter substrate-binding protein [Limnobaculum xujianqingii]MBK5074157.1 zinc ABC transporter substrate-binding protein [Limnobaculum xujianqingii]MBK5177466.1 zinc ABC transporter substrate-binding protein [Limnobaculum xujianqingii]
MTKSEIYLKMIGLSLQYIRYKQNLDSGQKGSDISCYYEADLVHNLVYTVMNEEFGEHDVHFLNYQARNYFEECSEEISLNYNQHIEYITELFRLVPEELSYKLIWSGP